jgi:hypothetical protein
MCSTIISGLASPHFVWGAHILAIAVGGRRAVRRADLTITTGCGWVTGAFHEILGHHIAIAAASTALAGAAVFILIVSRIGMIPLTAFGLVMVFRKELLVWALVSHKTDWSMIVLRTQSNFRLKYTLVSLFLPHLCAHDNLLLYQIDLLSPQHRLQNSH